MSDVGVQTIFENEKCNMVQGEMVLVRRVSIRTLYKMSGHNVSDGGTNFVFPKVNKEAYMPLFSI
jgi:hypothetical protein